MYTLEGDDGNAVEKGGVIDSQEIPIESIVIRGQPTITG